MFQSRNRDSCHFRLRTTLSTPHSQPVSISQSRFLSFQVAKRAYRSGGKRLWFQSRNRDSCHFRGNLHIGRRICLQSFNLAIEILVISGTASASPAPQVFTCFNLAIEILVISGLSRTLRDIPLSRFNLAIEILVISGAVLALQQTLPDGFQSRNRDSCHFRRTPLDSTRHTHNRFNLAIEILVISGS